MDLLGVVFAILVCTLLTYYIYRYYVSPAFVARKLRQHGLYVLPYHPLSGNMSEIGQMRAKARLSPLPSPAAHRDVPARIRPFYTKILSESNGRQFVYWSGRSPRLVLTDPEAVKHVLSVNFKDYAKTKDFTSFHRVVGNGLLLAEGADWHNQRTMFRPAFFPDKLKGMLADMHLVAWQLAEQWRSIVINSPQCTAEVEVASYLKNATADILARTSFGSDYQAGKAVFDDQDKLLNLLCSDSGVKDLIPGYRYLPTPNNNKCWKLERDIRKELSRIVQARLSATEQDPAAVAQTHDLLSLMIASKGSSDDGVQKAVKSGTIPLTANQIIDECKTFFFAGHETTAHLLTWTMMLLSLYQDWQEKLREEALEVCGRSGPSSDVAAPHIEQLNKLKLMTMVLDESLRLYSPVPELSLRLPSTERHQEQRTGGVDVVGEQLSKLAGIDGMGFSISPVLIHRDTSLWGDDAHDFKPQRFAEGASKAAAHPSAFIPFGFGPRTCIGQAFALMEAKIVLLAILQRFRFHLSPSYKHAPISVITMKPQHGMQIILELM